MIAGIIMVHGDNNGLVLPPKVAPVQVIVIPVAQHKGLGRSRWEWIMLA